MMERYLNPGSEGFRKSVRSQIYVDKTGLIAGTNVLLGTENGYLCVSRPRRFGKTMALKMLAAYYSFGEDTSELFAPFAIARDPSYEEHRNKYNVLFLNMQDFLSKANQDMTNMLVLLQSTVKQELEQVHADCIIGKESFDDMLDAVYRATGRPFVILIDEWDCIFRLQKDAEKAQKQYLDFLRLFMKDKDYIALAYMTGILPVKKYGTHSALNMFDEYSMTDPDVMTPFVGFLQEEVDALCDRLGMDSSEMKSWYDGYRFPGASDVYNPRSVVAALRRGKFSNYWTQTETYEALKVYIDLNIEGLRDTIIILLANERCKADLTKFSNDMITFGGYEDVLALLVHLGYLGYDMETKEVFIPNREIAEEFVRAMKHGAYSEIAQAVKASEDLLAAVWRRDEATVAAGVEKAHLETSHLQYNDENALSYTLSLGFFAARAYYTVIRELPTGKGFADLVFLPRPYCLDKPALVVELKWDKGADTALTQIHRREYPAALRDYAGLLLLVGISYDKATKAHECRIEQV
jgi:hypothetical protein